MLAAVFAGDRRVWRAGAIFAVPVLLLTGFYCLRPRFYYTGTDSVEDDGHVVQAPAGAPVCVPALRLPGQTAIVRLRAVPPTRERPALRVALAEGNRTIYSELPAQRVPENRVSSADFPIPQTPARPTTSPASLCVTADGPIQWGGTSLAAAEPGSASLAGKPLAARLAVWYLPRPGARESYLQRAGAIFKRAALFRPGFVGAWTYPLLLFLVLPGLALLALRCLALAVGGRTRRLAAWLFAIAALNACCWALITPVFQGPDEVDHFAYTQSLVERGERPSSDPHSPLPRWSSSENLALEDTAFLTDHQVGDSRPPWLALQQRNYVSQVAAVHPRADDGGGYTTSAVHGPLYYLALAPAYLATRHDSVFSELTLMRLTSALLGALVVLFTFLLVRELAPARPWLAVLAALLVAYEPMYGFVSGLVNNDVGVNAGAAALELLLIRLLRRGITVPWGALTGAVLIALPSIKGTGLSLYPVAGLVFLIGLWRYHRRADLAAWVALALTAVVVGELIGHVLDGAFAPASLTAATSASSAISTNASAVTEALHHIPDFLSYLWQAFLPRLPFMTPHFPASVHPAFVIFVERGWAAFGWYDVFFPHWVYVVILFAMLLTIPLGACAARREWGWLRRHSLEALAVVLMPVAVIVGFEAAYYTPGSRPVIAEFGRYAFPAIGPLAALVVGALHAFGRRHVLTAGIGLLVAMIALSYASQLLTLTSFYA
ncbi:MAG: DUF2142 domain-containing protein [Solirubrobacteraceae bacterium]|jgi:hypothetical protein